jgi:membrane associated rhomboid family serine protease
MQPLREQRLWPGTATASLLLACLLPEAILFGSDLGLWGTTRWRIQAFQYGGFWAGLLDNWQPNYAEQPWLMFASHGFLHAGPIHFAVNMLTLWSLGPVAEERIGALRYVALYLLAVIGGAVGFALLSRVAAPMVGASGALFGLAGAILAWSLRDRREQHEGTWPVTRAILYLAGLNLVLWWAMHGLLAWQTHLGGFVTGWIAGLALDQRSGPDHA